jgi:hypothetical protein
MIEKKDVALVTGASSGIGREMARLLAKRGHDLVLVSRSQDKLTELSRELAAGQGVAVHILPVDLADDNGCQRVFDFTRDQGIAVGILINNAGVGLFGEHSALGRDDLENMLRLNVISLSALCNIYGREMKKRGQGRILNIASTAAYQPTPFCAAYGASKSFVLNFSEALAKELEDYGVTVSCLSPGPTDTGFFIGLDEGGVQGGHFDKKRREDARSVAEIGLETLFAGRLSKIVGSRNALRAFFVRFAPRATTARISKNMMRN